MARARVAALREAMAGCGGEELDTALRRSAELLCDAELELDDTTLGLARELDRLAPFGIGNPRPRLLCRDLRVASPPQVLKEQHLKLRVAAGERTLDALAWGRADLADGIAAGAHLDAVVKLSINQFRGRAEPQLELVAVCGDGSVSIA
jgi:single-stranded-DNA-specific exonuclease